MIMNRRNRKMLRKSKQDFAVPCPMMEVEPSIPNTGLESGMSSRDKIHIKNDGCTVRVGLEPDEYNFVEERTNQEQGSVF